MGDFIILPPYRFDKHKKWGLEAEGMPPVKSINDYMLYRSTSADLKALSSG
jgi:hypothetical protein